MTAPLIKLNNGREIPALGLGTFKAMHPDELVDAVKLAIDTGYRHFDTAMIYGSEEDLGIGVRAKIADGTVKREEIFITSKVWNTYHAEGEVVVECRKSINRLGLKYVDLYLIHWPFAFKKAPDGPDGEVLKDDNGNPVDSGVDILETWRGMEECVRLGLAKSIGVSNFNSSQLARVLEMAKIKPVNNQVECHPYMNQKKLVAWCKERDITVTAYSPVGSPNRPNLPGNEELIVKDEKIIAIAKRLEKTPNQIILNYLLNNIGVIPIPRSTKPDRIMTNFQVFDFKLDDDDVAIMDGLNTNFRIFPLEEISSHRDYPFNDEF